MDQIEYDLPEALIDIELLESQYRKIYELKDP